MTESRSINHMKCYVFRMAQEKWNMAPSMTAKLFNENKLFDYMEECYDSQYCFKTEDAPHALKFIRCE